MISVVLFGSCKKRLIVLVYSFSFFKSDLPLNPIARLESLVLHSQVRGVEICRRFERFNG